MVCSRERFMSDLLQGAAWQLALSIAAAPYAPKPGVVEASEAGEARRAAERCVS